MLRCVVECFFAVQALRTEPAVAESVVSRREDAWMLGAGRAHHAGGSSENSRGPGSNRGVECTDYSSRGPRLRGERRSCRPSLALHLSLTPVLPLALPARCRAPAPSPFGRRHCPHTTPRRMLPPLPCASHGTCNLHFLARLAHTQRRVDRRHEQQGVRQRWLGDRAVFDRRAACAAGPSWPTPLPHAPVCIPPDTGKAQGQRM